MRYRLWKAVVLSVVLSALAPSLGEAAPALGPDGTLACSSKPTYVHAFHVEVEWTKKTYRRSEKAEVTVTVTRPAHEDPADLGVPVEPPTSIPVEGATVYSVVDTGSYPYPYGYGFTDAQGEVHFKISIKKLEPGRWNVSHTAEKWTNQGGCPDILEWGHLYEEPGFTVIP